MKAYMSDAPIYLCPVDFSPGSEVSLRYALSLADLTGAQCVAMHAFSVLPAYAWPEGLMHVPEEVSMQVRAQVSADMQKVLAKFTDHPHMSRGRVVEGSPAESIVRLASEENATAIVMSTHGRKGLAHMLLGSVTERVVRTSPVPVITVPFERPSLGKLLAVSNA